MERDKGLKARQEILRTIIRACGGVTKVSRLMGNKNKQFAENWIQRGAVPFVLTKRIAKLTGVHPALFNFVDHAVYTGYVVNWGACVDSSVLPESVKEQLKKTKAPEISDDLLWS